jgi:L-fucose isomerase-like protein
MQLKPKVGFMPISHKTFLSEACKKLTDKVFENLQKLNLDFIRTDYVLDEPQAREVAQKLLSQDDVDMIIYYTASWMEAPVVVRAINESHLPAVVWGVPDAITLSLVGAHEVAESLDEMGIKFLFVFGQPDSKKWLRRIEVRARAAAMLKELKRARVGIIGGSPTMGMYSATYDHIAVRQIIGPEVFHIDTSTLIGEADKITDEEAEKAMKKIVESATKIHVAKKTLFKSFKLALALQKLIKKYDLNAVSVKCHPELSQFYGSSACVANSLAIDLGIPVSCEGDVNNALSMFILQRLTGNPAFFHEYTTLEVKPGKVTIARLGGRNNTYRMHIAPAELLIPTEKQKKADKPLGYEGVARGLIKVKNIERFMNDTIAHHQAMAHGDVREELYELCSMLGIPTIITE